MIDWVSIVRSSGQRFSSIIGSSVPLKVRRRRRKRIAAQQTQQHEQLQQKLKTVQEQVSGNGEYGNNVVAVAPAALCTCELWRDSNAAGGANASGRRVTYEDEDAGSCSERSATASISGTSSTGNYLSTSPGCSSLPGTTCSIGGGGGISAFGNAVFVTSLHGSLETQHYSLCEVHGSKRAFIVVSW